MKYQEQIQQLKAAIEESCNRTMQTPKDFDFLSESIFKQTHAMVNCSTLKRLYGYIGGNIKPRVTTLNILSQYVGYTDWNAFCTQATGSESATVVSEHLYSDEIYVGETLRLMWKPNRVLEIKYEGRDRFRITKATNSKLKVGNTFRCTLFIQNEPLFITEVTGLAQQPVDYVCGKDNGITFIV